MFLTYQGTSQLLNQTCAWYPPTDLSPAMLICRTVSVAAHGALQCKSCRGLDLRFQDDLQMDEFPLGEDMHHIPGEELFDFMADKLVKFTTKLGKK